MNTLNGYSKSTLTDNYVLTAAGGHLAVGNASGNIPLSNSTVCTNLNADLLDDHHGSWYLKNVLAFKLVKGTATTGGYDLNTLTEGMVYNYNSSGYWKNGPSGMSYGLVLNLKNGSSNSLSGQLAWDVYHNNTTDTTRSLWWRASDNGTFTNSQWHKIAFLESIPTVTDYYWADVPISATSSQETTPTFDTATATTQVITPKVHSNGRLTLNATSTGVDLKFDNDNAKSVILNGTSFKPFDNANDKLTLGSINAKWSHIYAALTVNTPMVTSPAVLKINAGGTEVHIQIAATTTQSLALNTTSFGPFKDADGLLSSGRSNARWSNIYSVLGNFTGSITIKKGNSIVDDGGLGIVGINPTGWTGLPSNGSAIGFGTGAAPVYIRTNADNLYHYHKTDAQSYKILDANNSSVSDGGSTWGSKITVKINNETKTLTIPAKPTDTKNTAGSTNDTNKLFLIGAKLQDTSVLTYSNSKVYATDGTLNATNFISGTGVNDFSRGTVKLDTLLIPISSGGSTFGYGTAGLVLKSNGSTVYWGSDNNSNTWRAIKTNGESLAGTGTDTRALNFEAGLGINIVGTAGSSDLLTDNNILINNTGMIGYDGSRHYRLLFALGADDLAWKKIVEVRSSYTTAPTVDTWEAVTVRGTIWYSDTNYSGNELIKFPFCAVFKYVEGTSLSNTVDLYLPRYAKEYSCIRIVRRSTNRFELQVRQIEENLVGWIDYQVSGGGTINAYTILQTVSYGTVVKLVSDASILVEDRTYCVLDYNNTSTPIYIGYAGAGLETTSHFAAYGTTSAGDRCIKDISIEKTKEILGISTTINSGTSNKLAYYSGTNTISAYTSNCGEYHYPIYLNGGIPTLCGYKYVGAVSWRYPSSGYVVVFLFGPITVLLGYISKIDTTAKSITNYVFKLPDEASSPYTMCGFVVNLHVDYDYDRNTALLVSGKYVYCDANRTQYDPNGVKWYFSFCYI